MSDEGAMRMAAWIVDHPKSYDNYARIVARSLLSCETERDAMQREIDDLREFIRGVGINCQHARPKTAGQPSADGGKEGK